MIFNKNALQMWEKELMRGDAVTKHQMETGLYSKADLVEVLLLDGRNHMTGDLDLRGNKIIFPGEIDMDRN